MLARYLRHPLAPLWLCALVACAAGLPNIRIQVNSENFQSPPYLLEAIKQAEASEQATLAGQTVVPAKLLPDTASVSDSTSNHHAQDGAVSSASLAASSSKDETIVVDVANLESEMAPTKPVEASPGKEAPQPAQIASEATSSTVAQAHKPQLPVTSSHLKRPPVAREELAGNLDPVERSKAGAHSLVSPSVVDEDAIDSKQTSNAKRKFAPFPPDTREPAQVMQGAQNSSSIPATIRREYGQQSRTRVTIGGGYTRDTQPALVNPASSNYNDDKPTKPSTPLEKPQPIATSDSTNLPERIPPASTSSLRQPAAPQSSKPHPPGSKSPKKDPRCPSEGTRSYEHPTACDKYFLCQDGVISEHSCPNGLMYGERDTITEHCVHRWQASCEDKTVPNPISSPGCRWQYGLFSVQGSPKCSTDYYECLGGQYEVKKCPIEGQVFDDRTKSCKFAEQVGCLKEALGDFQCPQDDQSNTYWPFPRYFLNERALIHCVNDKPEIVRCTEDQRVDPEHLHCVPLSKLSPSDGSLTARAPETGR